MVTDDLINLSIALDPNSHFFDTSATEVIDVGPVFARPWMRIVSTFTATTCDDYFDVTTGSQESILTWS